MATSLPFAFGAEENYQFTGVDAQPLPPRPATREPMVRSWIEKAAALETEVRLEKALVAALHRQVKDKDVELAKSKVICNGLSAELKNAQRAESIARDLAQSLYNKTMQFEKEDEYEHIAELQSKIDRLEKELREEKHEHNELQEQHDALVADSQRERRTKDEEIKRLNNLASNLGEAYRYQRSLFQENEVHLNNAYADLKLREAECKSATMACDNALAAERAAKLRITELLAELKKKKHKDGQHEQLGEDLKVFEEDNIALQQEIDDLCSHKTNSDRTIELQTMRIVKLEEDLQECEQKLAAAAAAAVESVSTVKDSLQDELAASSDFVGDDFDDYDDSAYEQMELLGFSPVYYVDVHPIATASAPDHTIAFGEHISIAPVVHQIKTTNGNTQTDTPALTIHLVDAATVDIAPMEVQKPDIVPTKSSPLGSNLTNFLMFSLIFIVAGLLRNANGYGSGYDDTFMRGGAYGNGRKLFGLVDMAMDIGTSDMSESIARTMYVVIMLFERWTGSTYNYYY